jgi:hypothetical protein
MKISTNSIGNYSPKINNTTPAKNVEKQASVSSEKNIVNKQEKKFFADMYPQNKKEIMNYHYYKKTGNMSGVSVGSLLDRRG